MSDSGRRFNPLRTGRGRHASLDRPTGTPVVPDELQVRRQAVVPEGEGGAPGGGAAARVARRLFERDWLVLAALVVVAAVLRFWDLGVRGVFDSDQAHDVLTLRALVEDGVVPLLGPPTSIGDFHHGAAYYVLLAPIAWLSGSDPTAITGFIAALGVAAVAVTWWFAGAVGGRVAAGIAGLLMAVSPALVEESIFIWNPNPIPFFAAAALACAWRGHVTGRARWWTAAVAGAGMVVQLHVLGIVFLPAILGLAVADAVKARRRGRSIRQIARGVLAGLGIVALLYVPLAVHELQTDFAEVRRAIGYFTASGDEPGTDPVLRVVIAYFRVVGWPLAGLVTEAPVGALIAVTVATILGAWLAVSARGELGTAARWLGATVLWGALALAVLAPSLQSVVPGLPNDHYHAFLDPVVIVLVALAVRAFARGGSRADQRAEGRGDVAARALATAGLVALVALDLSLAPMRPDPNGGWPAARAAGERIVAAAEGPYDVRTLPVFKSAEGLGMPVIWAGGEATIATNVASNQAAIVPSATLVLVCDRLFDDVIGEPCGGPAEDRFLGHLGVSAGLYERFDVSPRTSVTVYLTLVETAAP